MERLRAGVIGVGAIAQIMHLPYLRELDDRFQIAALCDVDPVVLAEVGRQYGVDRLFASADELLNEPLDVVLILSSGDHGPVTIAALERGLHVLVEKPLAYTLRETDDVIAAAERAGKTLMVGMMKQYDPGYQRGVELVQRLRDLRYVEADAGAGGHALPRPPSDRPQRCTAPAAGGAVRRGDVQQHPARHSGQPTARPPARSDRKR